MRDEYDVFLDTWEPSRQLRHATLETNLNDPVMRDRLLKGDDDPDAVVRTVWASGTKVMDSDESYARQAEFFLAKQPLWSAEFRDLAISTGVPAAAFDQIANAFRSDWVDGRARRQKTDVMMGLKASIRDLDRIDHPRGAGRYVLTPVPDGVAALLSPAQTRAFFEANSNLLHARIPEYMDCFDEPNFAGLANLAVRRGVFMPLPTDLVRRELHYLNSYSIALGPVEQFAQTMSTANRGTGEPIIFSAPLPAVQQRVVAFAPFIDGMDLSQLELVVAPPVSEISLVDQGEHGGIREFSFD